MEIPIQPSFTMQDTLQDNAKGDNYLGLMNLCTIAKVIYSNLKLVSSQVYCVV